MILKVFSIRDAKAEIYNTPFYQKTHGEAERNFRSVTNDEKSTINKNPEDFDLYYLGEYDDNKGTFVALDTPQHCLKAVACVKGATPIQ